METLKKLFSPLTATLKFINDHFKAMLFLLLLFLIFAPTVEDPQHTPNLQSIAVEGPIFEVSTLLEQLENAQKDDAIRGVLLEVNSPGGAIAPSIELAYAIKRLQAEKPVVVYAGGVLASGSYYASIWSDEIFANPGTMVGSIGVIIQGADFSEVMEKIGIKSQVIKAGRYKQIGTSDREWSAEEKAELEKVIQANYEMFVADVASARKLDPAEHERYADAHIFTAAQAKEVGLIDQVGVRHDAMKALEALSGVDDPRWMQEDRFDKWMKQFAAEGISLIHTYAPALTLR
ncbi:MAG: signal peptide peptidase SppA [Campylobacterales bacterium]|nr:signal peptide peptidase SppA [Campylobacterales bacterium]